ncbi:efflux RND transporter periplasmic adaptor subunit [uncultured Desulfuromonas sp.]|uniref:efflux RND transporter periplasmic adaptor subunit n=1 Tax=uncultured Desulfuromonas sp. TaxID=181013 RepID=UPI002AAA9DFF|nr:efflux RND transporter periplasmic adaptor subunit [uncultured Desulfuromonas sp.]
MKKILLVPLILVIGAAVGFVIVNSRETVPQDRVLVSGMIETTEVDLSFKIPGRLRELYVDEGDQIKQGQQLAVLEDSDETLAVAVAEAQRDYQQTVLDEVLAGSRTQQIREAQAAMNEARAAEQASQAELEQAQLDEQRFSKLYEEGGTSRRTLELYQTALKTAQQHVKQARAAVAQAKERLSLAVEGSRNEAILAAQAQVKVAAQTTAQAQQQLTYTHLNAPLDGTILTRPAEEGEYVQPGSVIFTAAVLDEVWARVYVSETDLGRIQLGQKAVIRSDSWPERDFNGVVTYISDEAEFTPKSVQTYRERINFMYRVKITLANPQHELKPGMPVEGQILLESP